MKDIRPGTTTCLPLATPSNMASPSEVEQVGRVPHSARISECFTKNSNQVRDFDINMHSPTVLAWTQNENCTESKPDAVTYASTTIITLRAEVGEA